MRLIIGNITVILHLVISDKLGNCFGFFFLEMLIQLLIQIASLKKGGIKINCNGLSR